ncbi:retron Eco8 family effector endonuclease [Pectobacterium brasiliense]|uniref:retron Eco8 family effector endonuclease n=1 Tax=Pectobacterium brasiliense TaxID=180957 RepID=UPI00406D112E
MSIKSISIKNILSFDIIEIKDIKDLTCIIGRNNVGKSNLLKVISFFYSQLENKRELPPELFSNYGMQGEIEITYDLSRIRRIVLSSTGKKNKFFNHIYNSFFDIFGELINDNNSSKTYDVGEEYKLKLIVNKNGSIEWSEKESERRSIINYLFPFFEVDARHLNLHDWDKLWELIIKIKSFKLSGVSHNTIRDFYDEQIAQGSDEFSQFIALIENSINIKKYTHKEKLLSLIKASLPGDTFYSSGSLAIKQSDGTNSFNYIDTALKLLITLTRREYISPIIFIDEPEVGLHPKKSEQLINNLHTTVQKSKKNTNNRPVNTPFPKIILSTHSPNIVKETIRKFKDKQSIYNMNNFDGSSKVFKLKSTYENNQFLTKFSDNEARLFFSNFILFVEGATEEELFANEDLQKLYPVLKYIDVYQCADNVISETINPSCTNASIPYLFLYDIDKAFSFKKTNKLNQLQIDLKNTSSIMNFSQQALSKDRLYYKKGYSLEHKKMVELIDKIKNYHDRFFRIRSNFVDFKERSSFQTLQSLIRQYVKDRNVNILFNTTEGALINIESKELFYRWLFEMEGCDIYTLLDKIKGRSIINEDLLIHYLRVIMNGKPDTQININKYQRAKRIKDFIVNNLQLNARKKTSGWVTSFLTFAIETLRRRCASDSELLHEFTRHFPEIDGIIKSVYIR